MNKEACIELVRTGKLSLNQMLEATKLSKNDLITEEVVKKIDWDKLSPNQILEVLEYNNWRLTEELVGKVNWNKLSSDQMLEVVERKCDTGIMNKSVAKAIVKTGRLSPKQMLKVVELFDDIETNGVFSKREIIIAVVETGKLSSADMLGLVNTNSSEAVALAVVETDRLSFAELLKVTWLVRSDAVTQAVIEKIDWSKKSLNQMFEAIKLSGNNRIINQTVVQVMEDQPKV